MLQTLKRGTVAGAVAGGVYGLFVWLVLNPFTAALEHAGHGHAHDHGGAEPVVSELTTAVVSAGGGVLWGILLGAGFGVAYFLFEPALPGEDLKGYVLAGAGFLTVSVGPWTVLPPAVPGAEALLATELRIAIYGAMMAVGAVVAVASVLAYGRVSSRRGRAAGLVAAAVPLAALAAVGVLSPSFVGGSEVGAELAVAYRWTVVFGQAGLWALIATTFARLEGGPDATITTSSTTAYPAD
ncbi:CbtA family protein [Haloparvum sp. AD34]